MCYISPSTTKWSTYKEALTLTDLELMQTFVAVLISDNMLSTRMWQIAWANHKTSQDIRLLNWFQYHVSTMTPQGIERVDTNTGLMLKTVSVPKRLDVFTNATLTYWMDSPSDWRWSPHSSSSGSQRSAPLLFGRTECSSWRSPTTSRPFHICPGAKAGSRQSV